MRQLKFTANEVEINNNDNKVFIHVSAVANLFCNDPTKYSSGYPAILSLKAVYTKKLVISRRIHMQ